MYKNKQTNLLWKTLNHQSFDETFPTLSFEGKKLTGPYFVEKYHVEEIKNMVFDRDKDLDLVLSDKPLVGYFAGSDFQIEDDMGTVDGTDLGYKVDQDDEYDGESLRLIFYTKDNTRPTGYFEILLDVLRDEEEITLSIYLKKVFVDPNYRKTQDWLVLTTSVCHFLENFISTFFGCLPKSKRLATVLHADYVSQSGVRIGDTIFEFLCSTIDMLKDDKPEHAHRIGDLEREMGI